MHDTEKLNPTVVNCSSDMASSYMYVLVPFKHIYMYICNMLTKKRVCTYVTYVWIPTHGLIIRASIGNTLLIIAYKCDVVLLNDNYHNRATASIIIPVRLNYTRQHVFEL